MLAGWAGRDSQSSVELLVGWAKRDLLTSVEIAVVSGS